MIMPYPLVSIIIPAYNSQAFIGQTIESVINQSYPDWELLVIDDGSIDGTAAIVKSYLADSRVKYRFQANQERAAARNHGIRHACGKYIAFLDADDLWLPDKLRLQIEYLNQHPEVGLCFTHYGLINRQGLPLGRQAIHFVPGQNQFYSLLKGNFISNSTVITPRPVLDKVGLFDETLPAFGCEDWDMWLRIARLYPIHLIDQLLALYRLHESNTSLEQIRQSAEGVLQKVFTDPALPAHIAKHKKNVYALLYLNLSETYLRLNQRQSAFEYWQQARRVQPSGLFSLKRGWWTMLKLFLPYSVISKLPKLRSWLKTKGATFNSRQNQYLL